MQGYCLLCVQTSGTIRTQVSEMSVYWYQGVHHERSGGNAWTQLRETWNLAYQCRQAVGDGVPTVRSALQETSEREGIWIKCAIFCLVRKCGTWKNTLRVSKNASRRTSPSSRRSRVDVLSHSKCFYAQRSSRSLISSQ